MTIVTKDKDEKGISSSACTLALTVGHPYFILIIKEIRVDIRTNVLVDRYMSDR